MNVIQSQAAAGFQCLGDTCEDTCCRGWDMQVAPQTVEKYKAEAPELLDTVVERDGAFIMKRDATTDYCVKFDAGWCGIHRDRGAEFLGDACHFFPRITRAMGDTVLTSVTLSCPEAARSMLGGEGGFGWVPAASARVPYSMKQYLAEGLSEEDALGLHALFLAEAGNPDFPAEMNVMRLLAMADALQLQPQAQWLQAASFYAKMAAGRVPAPEAVATDPFNLAHALVGLVGASKASDRPRLELTTRTLCEVLGMTIDGAQVQLQPDAAQRFLAMQHHWRAYPDMQDVLRRYLQAQMSIAFFPFAGFGTTLVERMTIIGVRFATVKLALMAEARHTGAAPTPEATVRVVQSLSRFLDHLADPTLSLQIYHEAGWVRAARLHGLLMV